MEKAAEGAALQITTLHLPLAVHYHAVAGRLTGTIRRGE
jgi:hypothetical protein